MIKVKNVILLPTWHLVKQINANSPFFLKKDTHGNKMKILCIYILICRNKLPR